MVRTVAAKAVSSVSMNALAAGRAGKARLQKRWVGVAERGGHHVELSACGITNPHGDHHVQHPLPTAFEASPGQRAPRRSPSCPRRTLP